MIPALWMKALQGQRNIESNSAQGLITTQAIGVPRSTGAFVPPSNELTPTASRRPIPDTNKGGHASDLQGMKQDTVSDISMLETSEPFHYNHFSSGGPRQTNWGGAVNGFLPVNSDLSTTPSFSAASSSYGPALFQYPFAALPGEGQPPHLVLRDSSQEAFGIGQRSDSAVNQPTALRTMTLMGLDAPVRARINANIQNSCVYRDFLMIVLKDHPWRDMVHPYPPGSFSVTVAGYNPRGGHFIRLNLRDRETPDQTVEINLTVLDRGPTDEEYLREVDMVLGWDYLNKLTGPRYPSDLLMSHYPSAAPSAGTAPSLPGGNSGYPNLPVWPISRNWIPIPDLQYGNQFSSQSDALSMQSGSGIVVSTAPSSGVSYLADDQATSLPWPSEMQPLAAQTLTCPSLAEEIRSYHAEQPLREE